MAEKRKKRKYAKRKKAAVKLPLFVVILLIVLAVVAYVLYTRGFFDRWLKKEVDPVYTDELQIHFLELGNKNSGDSVLIKTGDTEVLVDAGSKPASAQTIGDYVDKYCTDGVLEYVVVTHAHEDHIAGFVGTKSAQSLFRRYECKTIIDFPRWNTTSAIYNNYVAERTAEVEAGAVHYTALECWNGENGASRSYELAPDITLNILYQKYYEQKSSSENNYSVCFLLSQGNNHYLFTGDLERAGEISLVENNDLPQCKLFKAGHHGSQTSSSDELLSVIRPEVVCVCCCCGYQEYTDDMANVFPSQSFCDTVAKYTDLVYVTTVYSETAEGNHESLNGNIVVTSDGDELTVHCSGSEEPFTKCEWYIENRKKAA